ncbi:hypothetical protein HYPSUDRAFT_215305 [Hypholoma sublateritium FD-334 SS-4]|uniref:Uncharacterized protein n=1 Tax=Hypholoma sublateritium (strain FD-334 SS-4) TaxID=945553 RepID=A0A0D2L7X3_HYPSF|nr:hypothetical protein HYPSUDRAFT_215305 [Hypholoma sublateritium FD-334 SS-4]
MPAPPAIPFRTRRAAVPVKLDLFNQLGTRNTAAGARHPVAYLWRRLPFCRVRSDRPRPLACPTNNSSRSTALTRATEPGHRRIAQAAKWRRRVVFGVLLPISGANSLNSFPAAESDRDLACSGVAPFASPNWHARDDVGGRGTRWERGRASVDRLQSSSTCACANSLWAGEACVRAGDLAADSGPTGREHAIGTKPAPRRTALRAAVRAGHGRAAGSAPNGSDRTAESWHRSKVPSLPAPGARCASIIIKPMARGPGPAPKHSCTPATSARARAACEHGPPRTADEWKAKPPCINAPSGYPIQARGASHASHAGARFPFPSGAKHTYTKHQASSESDIARADAGPRPGGVLGPGRGRGPDARAQPPHATPRRWAREAHERDRAMALGKRAGEQKRKCACRSLTRQGRPSIPVALRGRGRRVPLATRSRASSVPFERIRALYLYVLEARPVPAGSHAWLV